MKNLSKVLALVLVVAMVFSLAVSAGAAVSYKDQASVNYDEAVQLLSALNVLNGYDTDGDGKGDTFKPGANIKRGELAVMISYMVANEDAIGGTYNDIAKLNADYKSLCTFADSKAHWAAGFIAFCAGNGYVSGRGADKFDPEANVTVAEAAVILLRVLGYDAATEEYGTSKGTVKGYNTQLDARNTGLLNGLENVDFFAPATREQVAQLFMNALDAETVAYNYTLTPGLSLSGTVAYGTGDKLVEDCFWPVEKIVAFTNGGLQGHQWVAYQNVQHFGAYTELTDVFVDDTVLFTYAGGTAYSKVASDLGLKANSANIYARAFVNGADVYSHTNHAEFASLPGYTTANYGLGSLNDFFTKGTSKLPDNCTLTIVRHYDTSVGATVYKLMYNYEFVATVSKPVLVTSTSNPYFGQYGYAFTYYWKFTQEAADAKTVWVYDASNTAYSTDAYYIVVPNSSNRNNVANYPVDSYVEAFLDVKVAQTVPSFKATNGYSDTFGLNNNHYIYNATTKYNVSANAHDFGGAAYNTDLMLIMNSAGYVAGYAKNAAASQIAATGYAYVDGFEYSVTTDAPAYWLGQYTPTWSAQAKAQVYFPAIGGNATPTVIDIKTVQTYQTGTNYGGYAMINNANTVDHYEEVASGAAAGFVQLPLTQTDAYWDAWKEYNWSNNQSNIRVYETTFDGWYEFVQYKDGTYALQPVGAETISVTKNNGNVTFVDDTVDANGNAVVANYLTSSTTLYTYVWDLATKTATQTLVATGYKNFGGNFGVDAAPAFHTRKGTEVSVGKVGTTTVVTNIEEFFVKSAGEKYAYSWFAKAADYNYAAGQYGLVFYVGGSAETLYCANSVTVTTSSGAVVTRDPDQMYNIFTANAAKTDKFAYELTVVNGKITAVKVLALTTATVNNADINGYVGLDSNTTVDNYNTAYVWNVAVGGNGVADTPAKGDVIYYYAGDLNNNYAYDAMWIGVNAPGTAAPTPEGYIGNWWWVPGITTP